MSWSTTVPTTGSLIVDIPTIYTQNWIAIENFFGKEHYTFTSPLSGRHLPGIVGALYSGTTTAITGISSPVSGALAFDTTLGVMKTYGALGAQWDQVNMLPYSRVIVYQSSDIPVASGGFGIGLFDTKIVDSLSEYSTTSHIFTPLVAGYYFINYTIQVQSVARNQCIFYMTYYHLNLPQQSTYDNDCVLSSDYTTYNYQNIIYLSPGDLVYFILYSVSATATIKGGSDLSYLNIYRMS